MIAFHPKCSPGHVLTAILFVFALMLSKAESAPQQPLQQPPQQPPIREVLVEIYYVPGQATDERYLQLARQFVSTRSGVQLVFRSIQDHPKNVERLRNLARHYRFDEPTTPVMFACGRVLWGLARDEEVISGLQTMLRIEMYSRPGCSRCVQAKQFLKELLPSYPGLELVECDISGDARVCSNLLELVKKFNQTASSVPVFHLCNQMLVGFDRPEGTGERLKKILDKWTVEKRAVESPTGGAVGWPVSPFLFRFAIEPPLSPRTWPPLGLLIATTGAAVGQPAIFKVGWAAALSGPDRFSQDELDEPDEFDFELPIPDADADEEQAAQLSEVDLGWWGKVHANHLGMPLFTIAVGLVDGFNPCAMWVLLFLLSILVNLKDRKRIILVAATFVLISGLAYFLFMAAWLNVFLLVGFLRPVQIGLGLLAISVGAIHVKDFFAFKQGLSLSIPESAKPGIYQRVRDIVTAKNIWAALLGAITLAVLVNIIELLCTAGLPALYTQILTMQGYPTWKNYAYLALYNVAYMFDDALMVAIVVWTLGKRKLQEREGRWLKLISGLVIVILGFVMLFRPSWLS